MAEDLNSAQGSPRPSGKSSTNSSGAQAYSKHRQGGKRWEGGGKKSKFSEKSRAEWRRETVDRRERNDNTQRKRLKRDEDGKPPPVYVTEFSKEEIDSEERRPKRKVAVLFGYAGTGYKGLQLSDQEKTIEGEIFQAFVAAGAVSKANADDPKKTALIRCARTDKGVHAAGNVISMKLIIEDEDIVQKINANLSPQIRIWGMERTNGSFSAYQLCDSRIYEYLIPTHCFIPPHPNSFLGKKLVELAVEENDLEGYNSRQADVSSFWSDAEEKYIDPVLETLDPEVRAQALKIIFEGGTRQLKDQTIQGELASQIERSQHDPTTLAETSDQAADEANPAQDAQKCPSDAEESTVKARDDQNPKRRILSDLERAIRAIKSAYQSAKLNYRISPTRLALVQSSLSRYVGTHNYHNYTINKSASDPSAKRVMKSFVAASAPILIQNTEWLSLKVHGQSFMMHQIRKMVSLCALVVRCGTHEGRIQDTFAQDKYVIPTAPGLGLLLERPVFDSYNQKRRGGVQSGAAAEAAGERPPIDFDKYRDRIEEFKQREIYERIWREGEHEQPYLGLFSSLDNLRSAQLLYLSSQGLKATRRDLSLELGGAKAEDVADVGAGAQEVEGEAEEEPADS